MGPWDENDAISALTCVLLSKTVGRAWRGVSAGGGSSRPHWNLQNLSLFFWPILSLTAVLALHRYPVGVNTPVLIGRYGHAG